ncbi:MAG: iron-sulfur cluster assembly accessory protein [Myxococcales bacterium]|nr:iron-sulfur cluster assembly accessory protein [Myxococcales bacterium]
MLTRPPSGPAAPPFRFTPEAAAKVRQVQADQKLDDAALRVSAVPETAATFQYGLRFISETDLKLDDQVFDADGFVVILDPQSVLHLQGATVDYVDTLGFSGFRFDNPNKPPLLEDPVAARLQELIDEEVNPGLAGHGGRVLLVDYKDARAFLRFAGGCHGCSQVDLTLKDGVERLIHEKIPEVAEVIDVTDHGAGENPYYR